jgi:pimeloyl-ACP methyl ester carboxylesterase
LLNSRDPRKLHAVMTDLVLLPGFMCDADLWTDMLPDLARIACPALVVACRQDRLRTFAETERMAQCLPHARFEVIENCGHMAPLERPRELAALLVDWVERDVPAAVRTA